MIVLARGADLVLIRQLDHAGLAGAFAERWGGGDFEAPSPHASVVLAASRHDEGWRESDDECRLDEARRRPLSFLDASIEDYVELYAAGIGRVAEIDPYAGLLVSMHGSGNVTGRWGAQPGVRLTGYDATTWVPVIERFILDQEQVQARLKLALLGVPTEVRRSSFERRLWAHYELLQVWDRLSLLVCRADGSPGDAVLVGEAPARIDGAALTPFTARALGDGRFTLAPWPFAVASFDVAVPIARIEDRAYASAAEARAAAAAGAARVEAVFERAPVEAMPAGRREEA